MIQSSGGLFLPSFTWAMKFFRLIPGPKPMWNTSSGFGRPGATQRKLYGFSVLFLYMRSKISWFGSRADTSESRNMSSLRTRCLKIIQSEMFALMSGGQAVTTFWRLSVQEIPKWRPRVMMVLKDPWPLPALLSAGPWSQTSSKMTHILCRWVWFFDFW